MDRRQIKTRKAIFEAFHYLVVTGSFNDLTVQDILDQANISRSTFYAHFRSKEDLLDAFLKRIFDHVFADGLERENSHDFSRNTPNYHIILLHTVYHLKDNEEQIAGLLKDSTSTLFFSYLDKYVTTLARNYILTQVHRKNYKISDELLLSHILGSFNNVVKWWFEEGLKTSPEDVCDAFESVIIPVI